MSCHFSLRLKTAMCCSIQILMGEGCTTAHLCLPKCRFPGYIRWKVVIDNDSHKKECRAIEYNLDTVEG